MKSPRRCSGLVAVFLAAAFLAACSSKAPGPSEATPMPPVVETRIVEVTRDVAVTVVVTATPVPTPRYESRVNDAAGTLTYPLPDQPRTVDPQEASDPASRLIAQQVFEPLFHLKADGSTVAAAASGFDVSADSTVFTVTLRSGMTWSDGQPVLAQHYVDGVCRVLEPTVGNDYYYLLTDIVAVKGARAFASGDVADCKTVGVQASDDLSLVITLDEPAAFLPQVLAMPVFWPVPPAASGTLTTTESTPANALVFNGPYVVAEWDPASRVVLTKNPSYWNASQVSIERVEFPVVPESARQLALYEAGDLQVAEFPATETERIQSDPAFAQELQVLVQPGTSYLGLNTQLAPTNDLNVRKAIASAIDREAIIRDVLKQPWHVAATTLVPPSVPAFQGDTQATGYGYSPDEAARFLAEAGYGPDKPVPPVEIWYNREGNNEAVFKAISGMLEAAGIPTRLVTSSWDVYLGGLDDCNKPNRAAAPRTPAECGYNAYRMGWVLDYADPSAMLDLVFAPNSRFQYTGWSSEAYDALLKKARAEKDEAARLEAYRQAEVTLLTEEAAVVPLQYYDRTLLVKAGLTHDFPPFGAPNFQFWSR